MIKAKGIKILSIGIILVIIQSFLQEYDTFREIYSKYVGYLIPVIHAFFITLFLEPIVSFAERKFKLKRLLAVILTIIFVGLVVALGISVLVPQIGKSIEELYAKLPFMQEQIEKYVVMGLEYLKEKNILLMGEEEIRQSINNFIRDNMKYIQDFGISVLWNIVWWSIALTKFFIGFFLAFLILIDKEYFIRFLKNIFTITFGKTKSETVMGFLEESRKVLMNYIWGRVIVSSAVGIITFGVMFFSGTPYAF